MCQMMAQYQTETHLLGTRHFGFSLSCLVLIKRSTELTLIKSATSVYIRDHSIMHSALYITEKEDYMWMEMWSLLRRDLFFQLSTRCVNQYTSIREFSFMHVTFFLWHTRMY